MIVDIIPTKKLPKNLSILSYRVPLKLEKQIILGQLVNIPLRNSITTGVINAVYKNKHFPYPLKNIISLVNSKPIFTTNQLILFNELAQYYQVSSSLFIHHNLPQLIKTDWLKLPSIINIKNKTLKTKTGFFWWTTLAQRKKTYLRYLIQTKKNKTQILFVVPQINDIEKLAQELKLKSTDFIAIHHKVTRAKNFTIWSATMNKQNKIFIGTRSSLFYPYINLKTIIIDEEHSADHKQTDMNPRYDVATVTKKMQAIYQTDILFASNSPAVSAYYNFKLKTSPHKNEKKILIVNNANVLATKNYTFISDTLNNKIKLTLDQKKSVFLFINKKGSTSTTTCLDCGYTFDCPNCKLPFIRTNDNKLICYHCHHLEELPPFCPQCTGPNFKSVGLGIQKIETTIKKLFPKTNIIRLDKDNQPISFSLATTNYPPTTIFIGTEFALDKMNWANINLIGIINADQLWQHTEFATTFKTYALFTKILTLSNKNATIIIQTFNPNHYIIKTLIKNDPELFYEQELKLRKQFHYPPFTNLIKLSYLDTPEKKAQQTAQKLYQKINNLNPNITVSSPLPIMRSKIRNKYKYNIILKLNDLNNFNQLTKSIPHNWLIDIHPQTLLD